MTRTIRPPIPAPCHVATMGTPPSLTCRPPLPSPAHQRSINAARLLRSFLSTRPRNRTLKLFHATLQPWAHHHLWRVGPHVHRQHINISTRVYHPLSTLWQLRLDRGGGLETQIRLEPSVCSIFLFFLTVLIFLNNYRYHDNTRGWQGRYGHQYQHHGHTTIFDVSAPTSIAIRQHINVSTRLNSYDRSFQRGLETGCWSSLVDYIYVWHGFRLHLTFRWYPREIDGLDDKSKLFFFRLVLFSLYD